MEWGFLTFHVNWIQKLLLLIYSIMNSICLFVFSWCYVVFFCHSMLNTIWLHHADFFLFLIRNIQIYLNIQIAVHSKMCRAFNCFFVPWSYFFFIFSWTDQLEWESVFFFKFHLIRYLLLIRMFISVAHLVIGIKSHFIYLQLIFSFAHILYHFSFFFLFKYLNVNRAVVNCYFDHNLKQF